MAALTRHRSGRDEISRVGLTILAVLGVAGLVAVIGESLNLPGADVFGLLSAAALVAASAIMIGRRRHEDARRYALGMGLASALMWGAVGQSTVRPLYHTYVGRDLQRRGHLVAAADAFERAKRYAPGDKAIASYLRRIDDQIDRTEE